MQIADGPYYSTPDKAWTDAQGQPQERAFIRGPGIDGTITGLTAHAEGRARAQQLNHVYNLGHEAGKREAARALLQEKAQDLAKKLAARRAKRKTKARR